MSYATEQSVLNAQWNAAQMAAMAAEAALQVENKRMETEEERQRPFITMRPKMRPDGNQWCALYGDDLQGGVAGFGDTPDAASRDLDKNWLMQTLQAPQEQSNG